MNETYETYETNHEKIKAIVEEVKIALIAENGSVEACCSVANATLVNLLEDEGFCENRGLEDIDGAIFMPELVRMTANYCDERHEWLKIDGVEYDATADQVDEPLVNIEESEEFQTYDAWTTEEAAKLAKKLNK